MATLKEKVDTANEVKYKDTENDFCDYVRKRVTEKIEKSWNGTELLIDVKKSDVVNYGVCRPGIGEYLNIVDRTCIALNNEPNLAGFKFQRDGSGQDTDGYWGEPVFISIVGVDMNRNTKE